MKSSPLSAALFGLLVMLAVACSGLEQQESSYKYKQQLLGEMAAKVDAPTRVEIAARQASFETTHVALPTEKKARGEELGKLNQAMSAALKEFEPRVAKQAEAVKGASAAAMKDGLAKLAGTWKGGGIDMTIGAGGDIKYKKVTGGTSKAFDGTISTLDDHSFEAGLLGIKTTFAIDKWPAKSGDSWKMTLDGVELTRVN